MREISAFKGLAEGVDGLVLLYRRQSWVIVCLVEGFREYDTSSEGAEFEMKQLKERAGCSGYGCAWGWEVCVNDDGGKLCGEGWFEDIGGCVVVFRGSEVKGDELPPDVTTYFSLQY